MSKTSEIADLIKDGRLLLEQAARIQDLSNIGEEFPFAERDIIAKEVGNAYHSWFAKAMSALPKALAIEFEKQFAGGFFAPAIKAFLSDPLALNPLWDNEGTRKLLKTPFLHDFQTTMRMPILSQISLLERMEYVKPGVLRLPDGEVRLPTNLAGYAEQLHAFLEVNPYENNVFIMMKYRKSNEQLKKALLLGVERSGKKPILASNLNLTDELSSNVVACLLCCKYGVALFDDPEESQNINPNVAYELGIMHFLNRPCLILKSDSLASLQSDILAKLYVSFNPAEPLDIVDKVAKWMADRS